MTTDAVSRNAHFAAMGAELRQRVEQDGPMPGSTIALHLEQFHGFYPKDHGFSSLKNFLGRWSPYLVPVGRQGMDIVWGVVSGAAPEAPAEEIPPVEVEKEAPAPVAADGADDPPAGLEDALRELDSLIRNAKPLLDRGGDERLLEAFCSALLRHAGTEPPDGGNSAQRLFDQGWSRENQRFFGSCLVHLHAAVPDLLQRNNGFRVGAVKLFDTLPDVQKAVGTAPEQQTYQKLQALASAPIQAEERLQKAVAALREADTFTDARQQVMRALNSPLGRQLLLPLIPEELAPAGLEDLFKAAQRYFDAPPAEKPEAFQGAKRALEAFRGRLSARPTYYAERYLGEFAGRLEEIVTAEFQQSPYSKPALVAARPTDKKHAFGAQGAPVTLGFIVENPSEGHAVDVRVEVETEDRVELVESARELGDLQPRERFGEVDFTGRVRTASAESLIVTIRTSWYNSDGQKMENEEIAELEAQRPDIPWEDLSRNDPYSDEPVEDVNELVGRAELLSELESKLRAKNIGSFWIYGQKRVGKTSLVKTLRSRIDAGTITVYLDAGDYISPDAVTTVEQLGRKLCESIQEADPRFHHLPVPGFAGGFSALDDFLRGVTRIAPDTRIIFILDEFDELPIELFRRGGIGDAFFLTIRSISGKPNFGFVLVGGEKMELILSTQGDALNKFRPLRVDYFDRDAHWSDFEELVRKPLAPWVTITDRAVGGVYEATAGNPFFAKLICNELFSDIRRRRDAYVTEREMDQAYCSSVNRAESNRFQHFWEDGIFEVSGDRIEERSMLRRRILLAFADIIRGQAQPTTDTIVARAKEYALAESDVRRELGDFERRKVLIRDRTGGYRCKVGLFGTWLAERGAREIVTSFTDYDAILERKRRDEEARVTPEEISRVVKGWGVYKGKEVGEERVRQWLHQFGEATDQRLMFQLLENLRFYSSSTVRSKLREAHGIVIRELAGRGIARPDRGAQKRTDNVLISYIGQAGKSGPHYVRLYADENKIFVNRIVEPHKLRAALREVEDLHALVLVDDFIGTGSQAIEGLRALLAECEDVLLERSVSVFFTCVAGFSRAAERIEEELASGHVPVQVHVCDPLGEDDRCFDAASRAFPDTTDRLRAEQIARKFGGALEKRHPLGYGDCQSVLVFEYNCPNNALPILWKQSSDWSPLFPR